MILILRESTMSIICKVKIPPQMTYHISQNTEVRANRHLCNLVGSYIIFSRFLFSVHFFISISREAALDCFDSIGGVASGYAGAYRPGELGAPSRYIVADRKQTGERWRTWSRTDGVERDREQMEPATCSYGCYTTGAGSYVHHSTINLQKKLKKTTRRAKKRMIRWITCITVCGKGHTSVYHISYS